MSSQDAIIMAVVSSLQGQKSSEKMRNTNENNEIHGAESLPGSRPQVSRDDLVAEFQVSDEETVSVLERAFEAAGGCRLDCLTVSSNGAREFHLGRGGVPWALRSADRLLAWRGELESRAKGLTGEVWRGD